jgi:hypothetical protein
MLQLFDFADPNSLVARRDQTTVPSHALFLMNSPEMIEWASHTADRLLARAELDDAGRLRWLYQLALTREPTAAEQAEILRFLQAEACLSEVKSSPSSDEPQFVRHGSTCARRCWPATNFAM